MHARTLCATWPSRWPWALGLLGEQAQAITACWVPATHPQADVDKVHSGHKQREASHPGRERPGQRAWLKKGHSQHGEGAQQQGA